MLTDVSVWSLSDAIFPAARTPEIHLASRCQGDWIGYRRKCYYFSEAEGNWTQGQSHCSVLNSSLPTIDSEEEKVREGPWDAQSRRRVVGWGDQGGLVPLVI